MNYRTLEAIRRIVERPGTVQEGIVASGKLAALERKLGERKCVDQQVAFNKQRTPFFFCRCGMMVTRGSRCGNRIRHEIIRAAMRTTFPIGTRIFYTYGSRNVNMRGSVVNFPRPDAYNWDWLRIQFDHLKHTRKVPVFNRDGWYISLDPVSTTENRRGNTAGIVDPF